MNDDRRRPTSTVVATATGEGLGGTGDLTFLAGGGETAGLIAGFDWASTPLGPISGWPPSMRASVGLILAARIPIATLWGEDGVMIYNDAYSRIAGSRHPGLVGAKVREGWPEVADFSDHVMKTGLAGGTLSYRDQPMTLARNGPPEQVWFDLDFSPLFDETGTPASVMAVVVETTEKVRAERRVQREQSQLHQMFEQAPGLIAMLEGPDHVFTLANRALHAFLGREVVGRTLSEGLPEIARQGFVTVLDDVRRTGTPFVGRGVPVMLDREPGAPLVERYMDFIFQPITDEDEAVTGIFVQALDVTERHRVEAALLESEARFRLVAENAPVMLWMGDADGACLYLNAAQRAFWGVPPEHVAAFDWSTTVHPDDRDAMQEPFLRAMREHTSFALEMRLRRADGVYRSVLTSAQPRFGADNVFLGMIGVNADVTEIRRNEAALRAESRRLATLNRTGAAIAAELDADRIVQLVSDACVSLIGADFGAFFYNVSDNGGERYTLCALSGAKREALAAFPMPRATALFQPTFRGEGIIRSNDILKDPRYGASAPHHGMPEGHLPVRSYLAAPVARRSGEVIGGLFFGHARPGVFTAQHEEIVAGIAGQAATAIDNARLYQAAERELAERRRAEAALQALNESLEERVADAIAERLRVEAALRESQKMEAIGKLTGGVAHDFNNLLQVISGNLQLLGREVTGNERTAGWIAGAMNGVRQGSRLASQLLAFGRRQPLDPKVVNVGRLVTGMDDMLRRTIGDGIEVRTAVDAGVWNSLIDPVQLETALLNLALNARDAMGGAGQLTIAVGNAVLDADFAGLRPEVAPGPYVVLTVTDTGGGIAPGILDRVFDPFFSTKPPGKGTGLGLSMVYGFVRQSGGHVEIESEPERGTTVRLYLPRVERGEDRPAAVDAGSVVGGHETILLAEDDDGVRATVVDLLSDLGYRVLTARDAAGALEVLEGGEPVDLLFTDVVMPGKLRSPELARLARERRPGMGVLFTSGYAEDAIVHQGRLDAGLALLSKPYTREALARKLRQVLADARRVPAARRTTVLVCEDDALIRLNTVELLQDAGMAVIEAGSAGEALAALDGARPDIFVIDVGLPDMPGTELARRIRAVLPAAPVIFATGHLEAAEAEDLGNVETVRKPYDERDLRASIERLLGAAD